MTVPQSSVHINLELRGAVYHDIVSPVHSHHRTLRSMSNTLRVFDLHIITHLVSHLVGFSLTSAWCTMTTSSRFCVGISGVRKDHRSHENGIFSETPSYPDANRTHTPLCKQTFRHLKRSF